MLMLKWHSVVSHVRGWIQIGIRIQPSAASHLMCKYKKTLHVLSDSGPMMRYRGFLQWWYPRTMGFPTKNDHFGVFGEDPGIALVPLSSGIRHHRLNTAM